MLICPDSMSTWLYRMLDNFKRARTLTKGAPVTNAWELDARGKKALPVGGVKGVELGEDDIPRLSRPGTTQGRLSHHLQAVQFDLFAAHLMRYSGRP